VAQNYHVWPDVEIDGSPISDEMERLLEQVQAQLDAVGLLSNAR